MVKDSSKLLTEGGQACLYLLRRIGTALCEVVVSNPSTAPSTATTTTADNGATSSASATTPSTKEKREKEIMQALNDRRRHIYVHIYPYTNFMDGGSAGASIFVALFSLFFGVRIKLNLTAVGVVSIGGILYEVSQMRRHYPDTMLLLLLVPIKVCVCHGHQVCFKGLIKKLKAAYDLDLTVIVPKRQEKDIVSYINLHQEDEPWLAVMADCGNILFAEDVLELLELALEGERLIYHGLVRYNGIGGQQEVWG